MAQPNNLRHRGRTKVRYSESKNVPEQSDKQETLKQSAVPGQSGENEGMFAAVFGFNLYELSSFSSIVKLLCRPTDSASLGVTRFMFGLLMMIDIPQERGMAVVDNRWGDNSTCYFPLFDWLHPLPIEWMYFIYFIMLLGAVGIMLGFLYRISCVMFLMPYWYIFLLDKTSWNNHSYLYGLMAFILLLCDGNRYRSLDGLLRPKIRNSHVPLWNYTLLRCQVFLVYFIAGLKKLDMDWMMGYSMQNLSNQWVFDPFRLLLTNEQIDLYIVHIGGLTLDMFVGFLLFLDKTRPAALFFAGSFHLMNSQMFHIGMFSYMMLATLPLFCSFDWPRRFLKRIPLPFGLNTSQELQQSSHCVYTEESTKFHSTNQHSSTDSGITLHHQVFSCITILYLSTQIFLPYSHGVTKGYNTWTNGLYGYSWDMMVHSWSTQHVRITYKDLDTGDQGYLDPYAWVKGKSNRWSSHADMIKQYTTCIADQLKQYDINNVELYVDVWRSLNDRFQQRVYDPNVDLLAAPWGPFSEISFSLPLLVDLSDWRGKLSEIQTQLYDLSNYSDVVFVADFPGLTLENYIQSDLGNTSITVLKGEVVVEIPDKEQNISLKEGQKIQLPADAFHSVHTVSSEPSCYMYIFINTTKEVFARKLEEYRQAVNASTNGTDPSGTLLRQFSDDPHVQEYKDYLLKEGKKEEEKARSIWQTANIFIHEKYQRFSRSFIFLHAAFRSILFGDSFDVMRQSIYQEETNRKVQEEMLT